MQRRRAFTLIELLVVIAIIAILAAILFPVFAKARDRAKQSSSLNNMKQLAVGIITYAQDHSETFPGWMEYPANSGKYIHNVWDEQIAANVKSDKIFNNKDTGIKSPTDPQRQRVITYGLNGWLISPPTDGTGSIRRVVAANENGGAYAPAPLSTSTVSNPSDTILLAELATEAVVKNFGLTLPTTGGSDQWNSALGSWIDVSPREWVENASSPVNSYDSNNWDPTNGVARDFYGGGGNYAFVDGHVQFHKIGQTVGLGKTYLSGTTQVPVTAGTVAWRDLNTNNMWNPSR